MRKSGLILSSFLVLLLFTVPLVFATPLDPCDPIDDVTGNYVDEWVIPEGVSCYYSTEMVYLFQGDFWGETTSIIINGALILNNASLYLTADVPVTINVNGYLETGNNSHIYTRGFFGGVGNITFISNGSVVLRDTSISHVLSLRNEKDLTLESVVILGAVQGLHALSETTVTDTAFYCISANTSCVVIENASNVIFDDVFIRGPYEPLLINLSDSVDFVDVIVSHSGLPGVNGAYIENSTVSLNKGSFAGVSLESLDSNVSFIDIDTSILSSITRGLIFQYWSVLFRITNSVGIELPLTFVTASHIFGPFTSLYSDFDGLAYLPLLSSETDGISIAYYSNYSIDITRDKYRGTTYAINSTQPFDLTVILNTSKSIVQTGDSCVSPAVFCAKENPYVACTNMRAGDSCTATFTVNATDNSIEVPSLNTLVGKSYDFFTIVKSSQPEVSVVESDIVTITVE
jgi:hypothetical protein